MTNRVFAGSALFLLLLISRATSAADLTLRYDRPAKDWQSEALPIGNGRLGAMIFGDPQHERVGLNEDSLWTGDEKDTGKYQSLGELRIDLDHGTATDYRRRLDLADGVQTVEYAANGARVSRSSFASHPAELLVFHLASDRKGGLGGTVSLADGHGAATAAVAGPGEGWGSHALIAAGKLSNGLAYEAHVEVVAAGGTATVAGAAMRFDHCDAVDVLVDAATDYAPDRSKRWRGEPPHDRIAARHPAGWRAGYDELLAAHRADYGRLFDRVSIDLGGAPAGADVLPTNERLAAYARGTPDPGLEALLYQYGRYLLISSSRDALPANLQGLWNNTNNPPWRCDYHSNINVQMNYWPAEVTNLSECAAPLFAYFESMRGVRADATRAYYLNAVPTKLVQRKAVRGWTVQTENGVFGGASYTWNPPGSAWYCQHLWDHYAFTRDKAFLRDTAYPILKEVCEFWQDHLVALPDGTLVTPDGWSPEHGPVEPGVTFDQEIVYDLFTNYLDAADALGVDADFRATVAGLREKLLKPKVGKWGQLQEWMADRDDPKDKHRHVSHMYALMPGRQISPATTPELANAARVSLTARGDLSTGWAMAWRISCWARLLDGDHAYTLLHNFAHLVGGKGGTGGGGVYPNLLCAHPPFQIDGNFGYAAGVSEMLLQSHEGFVHLLPALPSAWPAGSVKGLRARGNVEVDETWAGGRLTAATLRSPADTTCVVRCGEKTAKVDLRANETTTLGADLVSEGR